VLCLVILSGISSLWTFRTTVLFCGVLPLKFPNKKKSNHKCISECAVVFRLFTALASVYFFLLFFLFGGVGLNPH
jgi:hypothetical protein